jgi:glycosyltransferase involved in cell wall biosynthesis
MIEPMSRTLIINAVNIVASGGGNTHLRELLLHASPVEAGFDKVLVVAPQATLDRLPDFRWLDKITHPWLNKNLLYRYLFLYFRLKNYLTQADVLFSPAGDYNGNFEKQVAMTQNQLYYEPRERFRYFPGWVFFRLVLLQWLQFMAFRKAKNIITLTGYTAQLLKKAGINVPIRVIPHGIPHNFELPVKEQLSPDAYSFEHPYRLLYVSSVDLYKHQWVVAAAVVHARRSGIPVELHIAGPVLYPLAAKKMNQALHEAGEHANAIIMHGAISYDDIREIYAGADMFVFSSTCESFGLTLLEAAKAGLPVLCYDYPPAREILADGAAWFQHIDAATIADAFKKLYENPDLRDKIARAGQERARLFSWEKCAQQTFQLLAETAQ